MFTNFLKSLIKAIPLIISVASMNTLAAGGETRENFQVVDGVAI